MGTAAGSAGGATSGSAGEVVEALRRLLADVFVLAFKTRNFHWHVGGPHFRDYHRLFDEQAAELDGMTDAIAERALALGGTTLRSIGEVDRRRRLRDDDREALAPEAMVAALLDDNRELARLLLATHACCEAHDDVATASLLEDWIDEAQRRAWFLGRIAAAR